MTDDDRAAVADTRQRTAQARDAFLTGQMVDEEVSEERFAAALATIPALS